MAGDPKTPERLRAQAGKIRQGAQYADRACDRDRDLNTARELEARADKLEAEQKAQAEKVEGAQKSLELKRKQLIAKVKIAQKQLDMDDDTYRDFLFGVTKKRSSTELKVWEIENVLEALRKKGFQPKSPKKAGTRPQADDPQSKLIRSLWIRLHEAGKVNDSSEAALNHWVLAQTKVQALQWLSVRHKRRLIEQLKAWLER